TTRPSSLSLPAALPICPLTRRTVRGDPRVCSRGQALSRKRARCTVIEVAGDKPPLQLRQRRLMLTADRHDVRTAGMEAATRWWRSEEHTSELQSLAYLV